MTKHEEVVSKVTVKRVSDENGATLGVWYHDGIAICGNIEPRETHGEKASNGNRIQNGKYFLGIRKEGGYHGRYLKKYGPDFHKGMLCIYNSDDWKVVCENGRVFQYVLVHTGNTSKHTLACSLPNYILDFKQDKGSMSGKAYEDIYPILVRSIERSECGYIDIEFIDEEEGR